MAPVVNICKYSGVGQKVSKSCVVTLFYQQSRLLLRQYVYIADFQLIVASVRSTCFGVCPVRS